MSFMLLGILNSQAAGGGVTYWLATLGGDGTDRGRGIAVDSSDNAVVVGITSAGAGGSDSLVAKYDVNGAVTFQELLGGGSLDNWYGVAIDSSDNLLAAGGTNSAGGAGANAFLAKYNNSGVVQWQRTLSGGESEEWQDVVIDSSDNVYVVGFTPSTGAGSYDVLLAKYNSSGTIQWQRVLGGSSLEIGYGIGVDSSDNVYVVGYTNSTGAGANDVLLAKYNSSGTIQWQRVLGGGSSETGYGIGVDSSDNVYVTGKTSSAGAGQEDTLLAKYNSSGTIQWQRVLGKNSGDNGFDVAFDSLDNIYLIGAHRIPGSTYLILLAKYNSSGTIQWQRTLTGAPGTEYQFDISIDSLDQIYFTGLTSVTGAGGDDFISGKLPSDGSLTGTYTLDGVSIVYQASSLTAATSSLTAATSSLTAATSSLTSATASLTSATASLTPHLVEL